MYLFVFMYLFIYIHHDRYGNCNSELCWSAEKKVRGGGHYKKIERQQWRKKDGLQWQMSLQNTGKEVTSGSYKNYILENICIYFLCPLL